MKNTAKIIEIASKGKSVIILTTHARKQDVFNELQFAGRTRKMNISVVCDPDEVIGKSYDAVVFEEYVKVKLTTHKTKTL
jgi:hypothetical protein